MQLCASCAYPIHSEAILCRSCEGRAYRVPLPTCRTCFLAPVCPQSFYSSCTSCHTNFRYSSYILPIQALVRGYLVRMKKTKFESVQPEP